VFSGVAVAPAAEAASGGAAFLAAVLGAPVIAGLAGFLLAWWFYIRRPDLPQRVAASLDGLYTLVAGKYFVDELYALVIVRPLLWISTQVFWHGVDEHVIDGTVNGVAHDLDASGDRLRHLNSGNTRTYAVVVVLGAIALTTVLVWATR
jgi:NADH-quinone oxidoreductase subunit L